MARRKPKPPVGTPLEPDHQEFLDYLFLLECDVHEELQELTWTHGEARISRWISDLFNDWPTVASSLSYKNQDKLLWRIASNPMFVGWWLNGQSLSLAEKTALIEGAATVTRSIPSLFGPEEPMEGGYFMLWDLLIDDVTDPEVTQICLEALSELSLHLDDRVQLAALHGLGHLQHPDRPKAVDTYFQFHPELKTSAWHLQCREGTVM